MSLPLVSVVVPCYNHENYVRTCIESILAQTYGNIELIVIDDGSTDSSPAIIKELAAGGRFIYEIQQNIGLTKTLNKAISKYVRGKYTAFVASDDYWPVDKIAHQVAIMEQHPDMALCYGKAMIFDSDSGQHLMENGEIHQGDMFDVLLKSNRIPALTVLVRTAVLKEVGMFSEDLKMEDWDLWLKVAKSHQIIGVDHIYGFYRMHGSNTSANLELMLEQELKILRKWKGSRGYRKAVRIRYVHYFKKRIKRLLGKS